MRASLSSISWMMAGTARGVTGGGRPRIVWNRGPPAAAEGLGDGRGGLDAELEGELLRRAAPLDRHVDRLPGLGGGDEGGEVAGRGDAVAGEGRDHVTALQPGLLRRAAG